MRHRFVLITGAALLVATAALAQQSNQVSLYATNLGFEHSSFGNHVTGGGTVAFNHFWTPRLSTGVMVGQERYDQRSSEFDVTRNSNVVHETHYVTNSFDLVVQYHFPSDTRWKPYVGGGLRWSPAPARGRGSEGDAEVDAGVVMTLTRHVGLAFDGRLAPSAGHAWNPEFKPSVGLSWSF